MSKLSGLAEVTFYGFCEPEIGGRLAGLFCFTICCEGEAQCWLGLQASLHEDLTTGFQTLCNQQTQVEAPMLFLL